MAGPAVLLFALIVAVGLLVSAAVCDHPGALLAIPLAAGLALAGGVAYWRLARSTRDATNRDADQRDALAAAEQERARLTSLVAQVQGGILVEDTDRRIAIVNQEFCRIFGMPVDPADLIGMDCSGAAEQSKSLAADPEGFVALIEERLAARAVALSDEVRFADGRVFERDYVPIDHEGRPAGTLWQYREVTDRVSLEERLRTSEARNAETIATALDGVIWMDAGGNVIEFNPAAEAMFGYSRSEVLGRPLAELIIPERMRAAHTAGLRRILDGGASAIIGSRIELDALHASGHEFPVELAVTRSDGQPPLFIAFMRDITEHRRAARELSEARDEAVHAAAARSEFLATMSHEIRTPMYGVIGTIDLLNQTRLDQEQRELVAVMHDSAIGLLDIINSVLDFSKLEAGRIELASERFSLRNVVEGVADLLAPDARRKGLRLATSVAGDVPAQVWGDPGRVRQIVVNLAGNAVKFTAAGDVVIRIRIEDQGPAVGQVRIDVDDTGAGIPADAQAAMFTPFTQLGSPRAGHQPGSGLGLAITARLVEAMSGTVSCVSDVGAGTTLSVHLSLEVVPNRHTPAPPLAGRRLRLSVRPGLAADAVAQTLESLGAVVDRADDAPAPDLAIVDHAPLPDGIPALVIAPGEAVPTPRDHADLVTLPVRATRMADTVLRLLGAGPGTDPAPLARPDAARQRTDAFSATVLLVDDNDVNRVLAQRQLEQLGATCVAVPSGAAAIEAVRRNRYSLILMDCRMPEIDGFEATRRIRRLEAKLGTRTPIVALTADGRPEDRTACLQAGMDDHVAKPLRMDDLDALIARWCPPPAPSPTAGPDDRTRPDAPELPGIHILLSEIGAEETIRLFRTWKAEAPRRIESIRAGLDRDDLAAVAAAAHDLKSTLGLFGAADAAATAAAAEAQARNPSDGTLPDLCARLETEVSRAIIDLEAELNA